MKKILSSAFIVSFIATLGYIYFEPEVIGAAEQGADIDVTLTVTSEITLTSPGNIGMSPNITMTQNTSVGTGSSWTVKTNNYNGYALTLKSDEAPALKSAADTFADYTEATANTPETWSVSSAAEFGFSVFGADSPTATWGSDTDCIAGAGVPSAALKWQGFKGVTAITVATKNSETSTSGSTTTLCVGAEQNGIYAPSGSYTADVTGTATTQ